jgi:hypothetical protein
LENGVGFGQFLHPAKAPKNGDNQHQFDDDHVVKHFWIHQAPPFAATSFKFGRGIKLTQQPLRIA